MPTLPPAIILGGSNNALSVVRSLGRRGIEVAISGSEGRHVQYSRYCAKSFPFGHDVNAADFWRDLLLGTRSPELRGGVILPCNDEAIGFVARHRSELSPHYVLDDSIPELQLALLDKLETLKLARRADVGAPRFWEVEHPEEVDAIATDLPYPVIVKPLLSHRFQARFPGRKYLAGRNAAEVRAAVQCVAEAGLNAMICELIPGPDDLLASYYTYIDRNGRSLFQFTKRIIRRFPKNEGLASYHITDWDSDVAEMGSRFFAGIGFRGLGNVEFKRDLRDGRLKIIECNPRFTAAQELLVRCGMDIASLIYDHLAGLPTEPIRSYKQGMRLWHPFRDVQAYRQLRARNEITLGAWLKSICHRQVLPIFQLTDPLPSIVPAATAVQRRFQSTAHVLTRRAQQGTNL